MSSQMVPPPDSPSPSDPNSTRMVVIGVIVGIVAVILMNVYVEMVRRQARPGEFIVYRLETRAQPGDRLQERDVKAVRMPEDFKEAFSNAVDSTGLRARLGEPFKRSATRGDVLTYDLFIDPEDNNLDRLISRDMRLVALPVNSRTLPGNLRPGMYVDIEAPFPGRGGVPNVLPIMEYVKVLAVGRQSVIDERTGEDSVSRSFGTISIEVTPEQATQLSVIQSGAIGEFQLHLRNPADTSQPKIPSGGINPQVLAMIDQTRATAAQTR